MDAYMLETCVYTVQGILIFFQMSAVIAVFKYVHFLS